MTQKLYYAPAPAPSGLLQNHYKSYLSIVSPEAGTNLIPNPTMENGANQPNPVPGSAINFFTCNPTLDTAWQFRGLKSIKVTPSATGGCTIEFPMQSISLATNTIYTISCYLYTLGGQKFKHQIYDSFTGVIHSSITFTSFPGNVTRLVLPFNTAMTVTGGTYTWQITKQSPDIQPFWLDGFQLEQKSYATTFFNGDEPGCFWNGVAYSSSSSRPAYNSGGRILNLQEDLSFYTLGITGLGMPSIKNNASSYAKIAGAVLNSTSIQPRNFAISGFFEALDEDDLERKRQALEKILVLDNINQQELETRFLYQPVDYCGNPITEPIEFTANYAGGLEKTGESIFGEKINLNFTEFRPPTIADVYQVAQIFPARIAVNPLNRGVIMKTTNLGNWTNYTSAQNIQVIQKWYDRQDTFWLGATNAVYNLTTAGGVAAESVGAITGDVLTIYPTASDLAWLGGSFTHATSNNLLFYNRSSGVSGFGGGAPNGAVRAIGTDNQGAVILTGDFTSLGATGATRLGYTLNGGLVWNAAGSGLNGAGRTLLIGLNGDVYIGGSFTTVNGVSSIGFAKYNRTAGTFTVLNNTGTAQVYCMCYGADGNIYLGGVFTAIGGVSCLNVAKYDGISYSPLGAGLNGQVSNLLLDPKTGNIIAFGQFTGSGSYTFPSRAALWNGSNWLPLDLELTGQNLNAANIYSTGRLAVAVPATAAATGTSYPSQTTINYSGTAGTYPVLKVRGSGTLYQISNLSNPNRPTNLYFNYTLASGETLTINLDPLNFSITSDISPVPQNFLNILLDGSDISNFGLLPGNNTLSVLYAGSTIIGIAQVESYYKNLFYSIDGAAV